MDHRNYKLIVLLLALIAAALSEVLGEDSSEVVEPVESLTEELCSKKRNGCCSDFFMGDNPNMLKCMAIHSAKMPDADDEDVGKLMKFMSCFVECFYKKSKFIGKGDTLNMKMVKLEAETLYGERPKEKEYFVKSYEHCRTHVQTEFNLMKNTPGSKALLKNTCRPFFMYLHMCVMEYHQKYECPYFRWKPDMLSGKDSSCKEARAKCYAIDGIKPPLMDML
ncbi:uncharacterized protein LOC132788109 [Drosophila nasuta]|uniref:uncharacterized protein LOC132788109 n=1 Tax=Drosophila nasuta TaxID=42062 RepID=UPI00295F45F9|nr:uncharacterized protein LOC132788109 [Drosophila nasuta]